MTTAVNPAFLGELESYGAFDTSACFNCGNCTAVCPLSTDGVNFPRKMIRYAQIGARDRLLASKEVWLCYYCGECSTTCPRQAEPGEFMAAARRYTIASSDPTPISRMLYTSKVWTVVFMVALSLLFTLVLLAGGGPMVRESPQLFQFLSFDIIHAVGLAAIGLAALSMVVGVGRMVMYLSRTVPRPEAEEEDEDGPGWVARFVRAVSAVAAELTLQSRFGECDDQPAPPWYLGRRFMHWSIMWGFIGLLVATSIDYLLLLVAGKVPGAPEPIWDPTRLLGTVAGVFLVYGTAVAIIQRSRKPGKYYSHSLLSDWLFLWLLFLGGVTGFVVELTVYLPEGATWVYIAFLIHVVIGMEVVVLLPFTKFAHAIYRPMALLIHNMAETKA